MLALILKILVHLFKSEHIFKVQGPLLSFSELTTWENKTLGNFPFSRLQ